jgi:hypothetical protein
MPRRQLDQGFTSKMASRSRWRIQHMNAELGDTVLGGR